MANQWAIAIGINTYRSFQSLNYAQQDAEALCRHLIDSGITAPENCLLLTTASALHRGLSTFPERQTIAQWLKSIVVSGMGAEDSLWVFFSGYGVHANGEDYLMPVDGDPMRPSETGIAIKSLYQLLTQVPSGKVLIALDMNRNAGSLAEPAGAYTAQIAQMVNRDYPQIATVLSCQPPEQFGRESAGLRQGFFTAGLLEVMRSSQREQPGTSLSLQGFGSQLTARMAELCEHYWRPVQTPVVIGRYSIALGQTAANVLVGSAVSVGGVDSRDRPELTLRSNGDIAMGLSDPIANPIANPAATPTDLNTTDLMENPDWGLGTSLGEEPATATDNAHDSGPGTPLDINHPADVSEGFGDDFANTWAWSLAGEQGPGVGTNSGNGNANANGNGNASSNGVGDGSAATHAPFDPLGESSLDPYAAAWEEDFGDTLPFDANSEAVRNAQALLDQQAAAEALHAPASNGLGDGLTNGPANSPASNGLPANGNGTSGTNAPAPVLGGRPGHGGDGTDWHWADLSVAAATGDSPANGAANSATSETADGQIDAADIFEYPGSADYPSSSPSNGAGLSNGTGLVIAPRPALGGESSATGLGNGTDSNWNWSGGETAIDAIDIDVEPQPGAGLMGDRRAYANPNDPLTIDANDPNWPDPSDLELDGPNGLYIDPDDDPEGLPIVELDSDEFVPNLGNLSEAQGRPGWMSLRLLGALGVTSLVALALLGLFRGNQGKELAPPSFGNFKLPSPSLPSLNLPSLNLPRWAKGGQAEDGAGTGEEAGKATDSGQPDRSQGFTPPGVIDQANNSGIAPLAKDPEFSEGGNATPPDQRSGSANRPAQDSASGTASSTVNETTTPGAADGQANGTASGTSDLLAKAQARITQGQASSFNRAIAAARQIPPSDPDYDRARQSMNQWSEEVLRLSQQRAKEGKYLEAIATARLVPSDLTGYSEAQQSMNQWQIPSQLEYAKAVVRPGEASAFNRAISIARSVPEGNPQYGQARQLMQQWSNDIFEISQQRASRKQWGIAIAAAQLVPPDMPAYSAAQAAIADWQPELNKPK